jgi:hypothetical protein
VGRGIEKLRALTISRTLKRGYYSDGGGLYLQVGLTGAKSWVFRFRLQGRLREMGLGSLTRRSLPFLLPMQWRHIPTLAGSAFHPVRQAINDLGVDR